MYRLEPKNPVTGADTNAVKRLSDDAIIPFDPANSDYQTFKQQINDETAQLEDADGNVMSPEAAKAYVATLP